jgi:asparagine synthase (glutamine-hydrolysing)
MSAIFGIHTSDEPEVKRTEMQRLRAHLAYRGPDASGIWAGARVVLGNCLLQTTPESAYERMPASDAAGTGCITADVRIDNRDDLISALGLGDLPASKIPDSRLILEAYLKWGEDCPAHLLGDFAFAIWDCRTQTLFCARDQFGVKPFYYCQANSRFAFCSSIDGLLQLEWVPRRLNEQRLASHLTTFFGDTAATFYADILRLPPAHSLRVNQHGIRLARYWKLDPAGETRRASDGEYVEGFKAIFQDAVKARLRTSCKPGAMLSGGLDSSSIAAMAGHLMTEEGRGPLATFSGMFDEVPESNERPFIEDLVRQCGFAPSFLAADQCNPFQAPPELARTQAEVQVAPNIFINWGLYRMAQQRGVRVILDGFDGDTTISHGAAYLSELARANRWMELGRLVPAAAGLYGSSATGLFWDYLWHEGLLPRVPAAAQRVYRGVARRWRSMVHAGSESCCVLNKNFVDRIGVGKYRASLRDTALPPAQTEKDAHYQKLTWGVMPAALEMLDQAAAPFGIEVRLPFWDRRLIEFCLGLPPRLKIRDGYTRWILRKAMEGLLPRKIQWRSNKSNLSPAFNYCLLKNGMAEMKAAEGITNERLKSYVCAKHLADSRKRFRAKAGDRETLFLWQVANLTLWLERTGLKA